MLKRCIFCEGDCSGKKRAKEHIIPKHIQEKFQLRTQKMVHAPAKMIAKGFWGGHISNLPVDRELTFSGFLAGKVCNKCNNNWMSDLESQAQGFIYNLISGEKNIIACNCKEMNILAKWVFKTSAALSLSTDAAQNYVLPEHAKEFGASPAHEIPAKISIFGCTAKKSDFLWSLSPTWQAQTNEDIQERELSWMQRRAYKIFIQLGHLMLVTCFWPAQDVKYTMEQLGVIIHGENVFSTDIDSGQFFKNESENFLMSIGAFF